MRRFLALFATVAIVVSMFSGVVFAVEGEYYVELDSEFAVITDDIVYISGRVVDANGFTVNGLFEVTVGETGFGTTTTNGIFSIPVAAEGLFGSYSVDASYVKDETVVVHSAAFTFGYEVTLEEELSLPADNDDYVIVQGVLTDGSGDAVSSVDVALFYEDGDGNREATPIGNVIDDTNKVGSFALLFDIGAFTKQGSIGLYASVDGGTTWVKLESGEVTPATSTISVNIETAIARIHEYDIVVKDADGNEITTDWAIYNEDDEVLEPTVEGLYVFPEAGTYTVKYSTETEYGEADIEVNEPQAVNLINWPESIDFTEVEIGFGVDADYRVDVIESDGNLATHYQVNAIGAGITEIEMNEKAAAQAFTLDPTTAGEIEFTIKAWRQIGEKFKYLGEFKKTITVKGYFVEYDVKELVVGEAADITFIVKDTAGNPVNNAKVTLGGYEVDGKTANIVGGKYVVEGVKETVPTSLDLTIVASDGTTVKASITGAVKVVGERVYDVIGNEDTLLLGKNETIILTVTEDDEVLLPADIKVAAGTATIVSSAPYDSDEDGIKESIKLVVRAEDTKDVVLRAQNTDATKIGDYTLTVVKPTLVWEGEDVATDSYKQWVSFKVVDPRDGSLLNKNVNLVPSHLIEWSIVDEYDVPVTVAGEIAGYGLFVADWDAAADAEEDPTIEFTIELDATVAVDGAVILKEATLAIEPEDVVIGQRNDLTITLVDAEGEPLEEYTVYVDGEAIGKTDENGQVQYTIMQAMADKLEFAALTDYSYEDEGVTVTRAVTLDVKPTLDAKAPTVEVPAEVDTDTVVLVVKDNVRVVRLVINGEELNIFPVAEVKATVKLEEGVNQIHVQAMDNNYNVLDEVVEVTYTPPVQPVSITIGETNEYIDQAPYIVVTEDGAGRAMVPVRFIANVLGAELDWNADTKTATYTLGDIVVELTAGSATAVVNGENVALDVAAEITGSRMCVPVRFAAEAFGAQVDYEHATKTITITP